MLRYGIDDLRLFFDGDLRFLNNSHEHSRELAAQLLHPSIPGRRSPTV